MKEEYPKGKIIWISGNCFDQCSDLLMNKMNQIISMQKSEEFLYFCTHRNLSNFSNLKTSNIDIYSRTVDRETPFCKFLESTISSKEYRYVILDFKNPLRPDNEKALADTFESYTKSIGNPTVFVIGKKPSFRNEDLEMTTHQ